jgi:acetyl esterase/lipase
MLSQTCISPLFYPPSAIGFLLLDTDRSHREFSQDNGKFSMMRRVAIFAGMAASALCINGTRRSMWAEEPGHSKSDGTVVIDHLSVPLSNLLSPEARTYMIHLLVDKPFDGGPSADHDIRGYRARQDEIMRWFLDPIETRYPVKIEERTIGGVFTQIVTPTDGIADKNSDRVLLNVHGGGFVSGARTASLIESIPIASIERIKVISIDYRMGPESKFPAASEDVAAVYWQVLKDYSPQHIGLYGCSAGGMLTGMSVAWFEKHNLPNPAAIGILCASLGRMFAGDSAHVVGPLMGMQAPPAPHPGVAPPSIEFPAYLGGADPNDPLVYPINSPDLLAKFPPTLFITSTRGFEYSSAVNSCNALNHAGAVAELHVWDGLPHAFWYDSDLPESREAYEVIARFFDRYLHQ